MNMTRSFKLEVSQSFKSLVQLTIGRVYGALRSQLHNPLPHFWPISSSGDSSTPPNIALTSSLSATKHIPLATTARSQSASVWVTIQSFGSKRAVSLRIFNRRLARGLLPQSRALCLRLFLHPLRPTLPSPLDLPTHTAVSRQCFQAHTQQRTQQLPAPTHLSPHSATIPAFPT